jgi:hypothetical protein
MKYVVICLVLASCYSPKTAQVQFARAAVTYPEISAGYCARVYPSKDSFIIGKDSIRVDTLWGDVVIRDTVIEKSVDTVRIYYTTQLPGKVITRTTVRTDTIRWENRAALDLLNIANEKLLSKLDKAELQRDKEREYKNWWRKMALWTWFLLVIGIGSGYLLKKYKVI